MRFGILLNGALVFVTTTVSTSAQFSETRELPPLKLAASELDSILSKAHSFLNSVNGSTTEGSARESVKLRVRGQEIEIPHFSLASSIAFPDEIFGFAYTYRQSEKPVSSMIIDLGDSSRRLSISGGSADKVRELSNLLGKEFQPYSLRIGGMEFRRVAGACLSTLFLTSLMISIVCCWRTRQSSALGMLICSALGFLLLLLVPWNRFLPGFVIYQQQSPFFLVRHMREISLLALLIALAGIPSFYFQLRKGEWRDSMLRSDPSSPTA